MYNRLFYQNLYAWYAVNHRVLPWRETSDPYKIWLSEIILQQTRVSQGMEYYHRFVEAYPHVWDLAVASEEDVLRLWQGLGYYSRARNLHKAARMIAERYSPMADNQQEESHTASLPVTFEELRALPGVGEYTAGAIASFAYNLPYPALDGNVYRVLSRLTDCDIPFDTTEGKKHFRQQAWEILDREEPRLFNSAIMEFGALYCLPQSPDCEQCPLQSFCRAYATGTVALLPVRKPRPALKDRYFSYTIFISRAHKIAKDEACLTLIRQRREKDIWQHLYEFPLVEHATEEEWQNYQEAQTTAIKSQTPNGQQHIKALPPLTHILSHQRLHTRFFVAHVNELPDLPDTLAVAWKELDSYALSRLTLKALESINGIF